MRCSERLNAAIHHLTKPRSLSLCRSIQYAGQFQLGFFVEAFEGWLQLLDRSRRHAFSKASPQNGRALFVCADQAGHRPLGKAASFGQLPEAQTGIFPLQRHQTQGFLIGCELTVSKVFCQRKRLDIVLRLGDDGVDPLQACEPRRCQSAVSCDGTIRSRFAKSLCQAFQVDRLEHAVRLDTLQQLSVFGELFRIECDDPALMGRILDDVLDGYGNVRTFESKANFLEFRGMTE